MKKITIICIISLVSCQFQHAPIEEVIVKEEIYSDFRKAYSQLRKWEGCYGWEKGDRGGETYAGIARNYNKSWRGWVILDIYKSRMTIKKKDSIPEIEFYVLDYYLNEWYSEGFDKLKKQEIATYLFDYRNSGPIAYTHTRRVLVEMGYIISTDGYSDERLISILNRVDSEKFLKGLRKKRMNYYVRSAMIHKDHIRFLGGWLNRTYDI